MSQKPQSGDEGPRARKGSKGKGGKGKDATEGGQQTLLSIAGVVRPSPSADDAPSGVQKKQVQDALDARVQTRKSAEGAKEKTLQPNSTDQGPNHASASMGEPTIGACAVSMASSSQPPDEIPRRNDPPRGDGPNAAMRGKGSDVHDSHSDSDSFSHSPAAAQGMEVEPSGGRASSPSSATDVFRALTTPGGSSSKAPAPHLAPVPEGGETGGKSRGKNLSDGGIILSEKGSEPSITETSVPKIFLVINDPGNQPKLTMPHQILSTIQIEAKQCRIECPDYSMSIMEDYFDKQARCTTSYLVSLTQEVKEFLLDEGEIMVPGDEHGEVRLEVKDSTPDGRAIPKAAEADAAATAGPQGPTYKPKRDRKSTIVCQYRLDKPQLGKHYQSGQLDREAEFIKSKISRAFENVDFNYSVNLDQPAPMKHPINQLTAYIEIDPTVTSEDLRHVKFEHMKYVRWSDAYWPMMGHTPRDILDRLQRKSCCFRHKDTCTATEAKDCDFRGSKPATDRKREREEARDADVAEKMQALEEKVTMSFCPMYLEGKARYANQTLARPRTRTNACVRHVAVLLLERAVPEAPPFILDHKAHHSVLLCERRVLRLPFCIRGHLPLHGPPVPTYPTPRLHPNGPRLRSTRILARAPPGRPIGALRPSDSGPSRERPYMATCAATGRRTGTQLEISRNPDARAVFPLRIVRHARESEA